MQVHFKAESPQGGPLRVTLFGANSAEIRALAERHKSLVLTDDAPDVVVCYGGDGTLLAAELEWPGVPKAPILNSKIGHRCMRHPAEEVFAALAQGTLIENQYNKLECIIRKAGGNAPERVLTPLNEINVHKSRINSAVRYRVWLDGEPYIGGEEIVGDGFIVCTPFGSTAYFSKITRGIFTRGIGIAFKATNQHTNHVVLPAEGRIRVEVTRGPALLAYDCSDEYLPLDAGDELRTRKNPAGAAILTLDPVRRLDDPF